MPDVRPTVGLFVTCLVDLMRPAVGFAAVKLLEEAGCEVIVPARQTCCGQPAFNAGDSRDAKAVARGVLEAFAAVDYVVVPSGSCAGTIKVHYPELFADEPDRAEAVADLSARTYELTSFLSDICGMPPPSRACAHHVAYHDSCSGLRELGIHKQPRHLLSAMEGLTLTEMETADSCCGFGGLFCVKYPDISEKMVDAKVDAILETGADTVLGGDVGCLMNIAGRLHRRGATITVRHVAEVLAGHGDATPGIGEAT